VFTANAAAIKEVPIPGTVHVYRVIWRNLVIFAHHLVVYLVVLAMFRLSPFPALLLALPALGLIVLNGIWIGLLFGLINARLRDFSQIVNNATRVAFFITPIIWYADSATGLRSAFVSLNPLYYLVEVLRAPLLGQLPSAGVWQVVLAVTALGWLGTLPVYSRWRHQVPYWV
jgi:ABC-2 type transport system permease protein/lipopolysaccharide transport system permease protein